MKTLKTFLYTCIAAGIVGVGIIMVFIGIMTMVIAFIFIPFIWILAKIGCSSARFDEREISFKKLIKLIWHPK